MSLPSHSISLSAPAKVNLSLRVLGKREDGFHAVETRMCPISIADRLDVTLIERGLEFTCSDTSLPVDESNLVIQALRAFEQRTGLYHGWRVHLEKQIPSGAGLGGGSSDAAAMLKAMNALCGLPLPQSELLKIAGTIGSDVPLFVLGRTCDATGRGEIVTPIDFPHELTLVLIKPAFGIPTPWAYKNWASSQELVSVLYAPQLSPWGEMVNDLERPVFAKYLLLPALKRWLLDQAETLAALMSGSGATMFAVVPNAEAGTQLANRAQAWAGESAWVRTATTLVVKS
ncbi:MAG: 4-(cytidine 5'-diphospho)-2-C-methyl-D-erythritol kinase [Verrucomicrobiaceae bacterium]